MLYKRLIPLLKFERERDGVDLFKVTLTHHNLRNVGKRDLKLGSGDGQDLKPLTDAGVISAGEAEGAP